LAKAATPTTSIRFSRLRTESEPTAGPDAAMASHIATGPRDSAAASIRTTAQPPAAARSASSPDIAAAPQQVAPAPRIVETAVGVSNPIGMVAKVVAPSPAGRQLYAERLNSAAPQNVSPSHAATLQKIADMLSSDRGKKRN
jgi:hypothetical protein